jgi:hypothetical protein
MFSASKSTCDSKLQKDSRITPFIFLHCVYGLISGVDVGARPSHFVLLQERQYLSKFIFISEVYHPLQINATLNHIGYEVLPRISGKNFFL